MPELPEVEACIRSLRKPLVGRTIVGAEFTWPRMLGGVSPKEFSAKICGQTFTATTRRGKYLLFPLKSQNSKTLALTLILHLKMSGNLEVLSESEQRAPHVRVVFSLDNGYELRFSDTRKFGRVYCVEDIRTIVGKLGPEPMEEDFTPEVLKKQLAHRTGKIKSILLDQTVVAGIGNIYADEALWGSKIHPLTPANRLKDGHLQALHASIQDVLRRALKANGTNFGDGVVPYGQFETSAYDRTGSPCNRCGHAIERIVLGQRSAHFCPKCQKRVG